MDIVSSLVFLVNDFLRQNVVCLRFHSTPMPRMIPPLFPPFAAEFILMKGLNVYGAAKNAMLSGIPDNMASLKLI